MVPDGWGFLRFPGLLVFEVFVDSVHVWDGSAFGGFFPQRLVLGEIEYAVHEESRDEFLDDGE
jgi:hypothetical protein